MTASRGEAPLLEAEGLTKRFGDRAALDGVDLAVRPGSIHAVLGENGAGKTTLMNLVYGRLRPDAGRLRWRGRDWAPAGPRDALARGVGMVHQHFTLVPALSAWENVWLAHPDRPRLGLDAPRARAATRRLADRFGLDLDPDARVESLPVGARQRLEIAKALARDVRLLILDEPTAVLAPAETRALFDVVRSLAAGGTAVLFISHRLEEVRAIAHEVTVLRHGRVAWRGEAAGADPAELARRIVGEPGATRSRPRRTREPGAVRLDVRGLGTAPEDGPALRDVTFALRAGEILGVAGVDGNGQEELVAALAGLVPPAEGTVRFDGEDVSGLSPRDRWGRGLAALPGDRRRDGLAPGLAVWENLALREYGARWARDRAGRVVRGRHRDRARELVARHDVRGPGIDAPAASLSGGNQQKLLLARELAADPGVLVLLNPTRGLDVGAAEGLHRELAALRDAGRAVLLVSTDLDEVLERADRWAVLHAGRLAEVPEPDREALGALMLGAGLAEDVA